MDEFTRSGELLDERRELVVVATVVVQLYLPYKLYLDTLVLQTTSGLLQAQVNLQRSALQLIMNIVIVKPIMPDFYILSFSA